MVCFTFIVAGKTYGSLERQMRRNNNYNFFISVKTDFNILCGVSLLTHIIYFMFRVHGEIKTHPEENINVFIPM